MIDETVRMDYAAFREILERKRKNMYRALANLTHRKKWENEGPLGKSKERRGRNGRLKRKECLVVIEKDHYIWELP